MSGNIKGITIKFRGETNELDEALRKINKETKDIDSELKNVNKALKFNPNSVELWRQKQNLLKSKITETEKALDKLKQKQAQMDAKGVDKNSQEYRELQREIITTQSKLKNFKAQLDKIGNANLKALSEQFKKIGAKMTEVGKTMTTKVTAPIVAGYTVAAKYASDYEENLNKLDVAFGSNSRAVKDWANTARTEFGLSKVQATDAASAFGALGKGIGLTEGEAAKMSTTLAGLSADLGSYFNVGVDESAKALEGIFTGEAEALKKFGVVMTDINLQKFAEDQGLVWKELDQTEKTMLRYQYVLAKTKDAQGDFSRTSDGTANSTKIFQASLQDLGTAIGTNLLPIITPVIQKITELLNKFNELSPETQKIITIVGLVVAAIGPVLIILGTLASSIGSIIGLVGTVGPLIGGLAAPIGIAIAAFTAIVAAGVLVYKNWDKIKAKAIEIKNAVVQSWTSLKTSIAAIFNNIKTTITNIWTSIRTTVGNLVKGVKDKINFSGIVSKVKSSVSGVKEALTAPFNKAKNTISAAIKKIKGIFPVRLGKIFSGVKLPHFKVSGGKLPWGIGGKGKAPSVSVNWYKNGGIMTRPTVFHAGGEAGDEAILPLDPFWAKMDKLIEATEANSGGVTVNVYGTPGMNVEQLADAVERKLVEMQRRRSLAYGNI